MVPETAVVGWLNLAGWSVCVCAERAVYSVLCAQYKARVLRRAAGRQCMARARQAGQSFFFLLASGCPPTICALHQLVAPSGADPKLEARTSPLCVCVSPAPGVRPSGAAHRIASAPSAG